ncbi:MAG TPA: hypothetical protein VMT50_10470 [Steroidobacteraceae bacterium]|nr:hypothetical protein [Steroidobacteraceae bacterium]
MTDQSPSPPQLPADPQSLQRALMDRARSHAERDAVKPPRRTIIQVVGFALALVVVLTIAFGFDAFLSSMQRVMHIYDQQDKADAYREAQAPMPAFVVPEATPAPPSAPAPAKR